jgi:uncharacterized protein
MLVFMDVDREERMLTIYVDADACPVKEEIYRVAARYAMQVKVVANATLFVPSSSLIELVVRPGFAAADDYIAEHAGAGDVVATADIPLAARCLEAGAAVLDMRGVPFSVNTIGEAMAMRDMMRGLRADGTIGGGPPPMVPKDRSRFLSKLDELLSAARRKHPPPAPMPQSGDTPANEASE